MFLKSSFIILSVAKEDHSDADCLLVTVLTHGVMSILLSAYDVFYRREDLWLYFTADKCLSLAGKPKIFIFQVSEQMFMIFYHVALS